ncbi:MAG: putative LPS assembly protein LptD [Bacteroidota bacterium]
MLIYKPIITQDITLLLRLVGTMLLFGLAPNLLFAQIPTEISSKDTINPPTLDSLSVRFPADSTFARGDTIPFSSSRSSGGLLDSVSISADALDTPVDYSAQDSMIYDIANQKIYLYGNAEVKYETMSLKAGFIILDWSTNEVSAEGFIDSTGNIGQFPQFKDEGQDFTSKRMRYNFETQKGIIYDVTTTQQNLYVLGSKSKFVRTENTIPDTDSTVTQDVIYSEDAIFTTCNHATPHFGIRSKKQKVIPGKLIIVGPSRLEIAGVPTPLYLPFGFFPTSEANTGGLIFPRNYEYSDRWGFGLRDIQYYFPINDYWDMTARTSLYVKGTFDVGLGVNFRKRYKYSGNFNLSYARQREEANDATISFSPSLAFRASLNQATGAHPTRRIGGSINIQFNSYQSQNFNDAESVLNQQFNSNFSLNQSFPGKPYSFSAAFTHSQNARSGNMTINFPNFNFQTQTIYPFKRRNKKNRKNLKEQWYEQIAFRYQNEVRASVVGSDTLAQFFDSDNFARNLKMGGQQRASVNTSMKLFKFISVTPSVNYTNKINFQSQERMFNDNPISVIDTFFNEIDSTDFNEVERFVSFGEVDIDTLRGIRSIHELSASVSLNTTLYRTWTKKRGWLRGLRHTVKPSVSMNWSPDYTSGPFDYEESYLERISEDEVIERTYSPFQNSLYSAPRGERRMALNYSLNNIYEAKYFSKKDSTTKKLKLFDNFIVGGNYNFAADSLKWSDISARGVTRLFKGITSVQFSANWSPYALNESGTRKIDVFYRNTTGGRLLRFDRANLRVSTSLSVKQIRDLFKGEAEEGTGFNQGTQLGGETADDRRDRSVERIQDYESLADWLQQFRVSHNYAIDFQQQVDGSDTLLVRTHNINIQGSIQLSQNWSLSVGNFGYDFKNKGFSYPSFGFARNLHCWRLNFSWQPTRNVYTLTIGVIDSPLDFIKLPSIRNQADGQFQGF